MSKKTKTYILSIVAALAIGAVSALTTKNNMNIYETIIKPPLAPPSFLFPVVWSVLYILMGISAAEIYLSNRPGKTYALGIYAVSLAVNFLWSIIFFNLKAYTFAFVWLILLFLLIIFTIKKYKPINKSAAFLQIPYLLWVVFAGYLNFMIAVLN